MSTFTYYFNDFIYIFICRPLGQPVDLCILFSNFIYTSAFTCNLEISYAFIYVNRYVDLLTGQSQYVNWVDWSTGMQFCITQHPFWF